MNNELGTTPKILTSPHRQSGLRRNDGKARTSIVKVACLSVLLTTFAASVCATQPNPANTRAYIDKAWSTLTRSQDECKSLTDPKIKTRPVLYVPAQFTAPPDLLQAQKRCNIDVHTLPRAIEQLGEVDATKLPVQGLLYLPRPYVVPGGFFNEMYGWDSYFILLGLVADHRIELARDMVDNALFEVQYYGGVLNANRTYYLSRSQPPFLTQMMLAVLNDPASFRNADEKRAWLEKAYPLAVRNHDIWTRPEHLAGNTGLARYYDFGGGPVLEAQTSDYYVGVIKWLLAHRADDPGYLIKAAEKPDATEAERLKTESCDTKSSKVCAGNWFGGYRLTADYYHGDRAMRESGFDVNFHFGPFAGSTHHYADVGLNSLLYRYELDLHDLAQQLGKTADAERWAQAAAARRQAMDKYLWRPESGMYRDYDVVAGKPSDGPYLTTFYPLWAGAASPQQAAAVRGKLSVFELPGGLTMDNRASGAQWDHPFGWAPTNWLAVAGLDKYGFHDDAHRIAGKFNATIDRSLAADGTIREKYNMASGNADVKVSAGYSTNVIGFGWTNGVYLMMDEILSGTKTKAAATP